MQLLLYNILKYNASHSLQKLGSLFKPLLLNLIIRKLI